ncbi:hypothetical protein HY631_02620 [Candidatus Uhrbacteria bacterium]|nr:hypothetical protein [Candidatus Uhrbacteria bacterium]
MDRYLIQTLLNIGFNEKESRVLIASFRLGKATAGEVAQEAELKRAIVYVILEDLAKRGLMSERPGRSVRLYQAIQPEKLLQLRQQQVENFRFMLPLISRRQGQTSNIEIYDTLDGILSVSHTFGRANQARYLTDYSAIRRAYGEAVMKKWAASTHDHRQKTRVKQLIVDEPVGREFASLTKGSPTWEIRFLPPKIHFTINFDIVDDTVAVTSFEPLSMVVIHSKEVTRTFEYLFDQTWKQCQVVPSKKKRTL